MVPPDGEGLGQERLARAQAEHRRMKEQLLAINDLDADKDLAALDAKVATVNVLHDRVGVGRGGCESRWGQAGKARGARAHVYLHVHLHMQCGLP